MLSNQSKLIAFMVSSMISDIESAELLGAVGGSNEVGMAIVLSYTHDTWPEFFRYVFEFFWSQAVGIYSISRSVRDSHLLSETTMILRY